ncbi:MAG: hypothetical protein ACOC58_00140 [Chloroflexota bacterium]
MNKGPAKVWKGTVLTIANRHFECCGRPPDLRADQAYTAYFENHHGEQLVFQYDPKEKRGTLWHGDYSWEQPVEVMAGSTTMVMSDEEREWLHLVWTVATRHEPREFQLRSSLALAHAWMAVYDNLLSHPDFKDDSQTRRYISKQKAKLGRRESRLMKMLVEAQAEDAASGATR